MAQVASLESHNLALRKELLLAVAQMESDKWYKPEVLRAEQGIDKTIARLKRLCDK